MLCVVMDSNHNKNVQIGNKSPPPPPSGSNLYEAFVEKPFDLWIAAEEDFWPR